MRKGYVFVYFHKITVSLHKYNQNKSGGQNSGQFYQELIEIIRQRRGEFHIFAGDRMLKTENHGMKRLALQSLHRAFLWPVEPIAQERVTNMCHMYADLMGSPGFQAAFNVSVAVQPLKHADMGNGRLAPAVRNDCHLLAVNRMASDIALNCNFVFRQVSVNDRAVSAGDAVYGKLSGKALMSNIIFADDKRSGRILVDPVNDAWPEDTVDPGQTVSAVIQQSIYQSVLIMPRGGMNDHILRLIDDEETIILIENVERDVLGQNRRLLIVGNCQVNPVSGLDFIIGSDRPVRDKNALILQKLLNMGA